MEIRDARGAEEFIRAWSSHGSRGRWMMLHAAESQESIARMDNYKGPSAKRHMAAAEVLRKAAEAGAERRAA